MQHGELLAGRYRVVRRAGAGAMASVYEAHDTVTGDTVALKTLRADLDGDDRARARLVREARALSSVGHAAVVRYLDHGVVEGAPFLVMDWIAGETLRDRLDDRGVTPVEAVALAARLASGLSAAHRGGVVHRDLKPSNVMLPDGDVQRATIVDFGVARIARSIAGVTATGDQVGTPRYMAPEQIRSARGVDPKGDVFALGCVLFECLTGRPAFDGSDAVNVLARILFEPMPVPSQVRPDLPALVDELVGAMLERDVARRADAAAAEARALATLAALTTLDRAAPLPAATARGAASGGRARPASRPASIEALAWERTVDAAPPPSFLLGATALAPAARRALPAHAGQLVGRDDERDRLVALLGAGAPMVVLWGGPGMGKTRLAVEAVRQLAARPDPPWDALVYADLSEARGADDIVRIIATEAGVSLGSSDAPEAALGRALAKLGRVLLVADPVEHVAALFATLTRAFARQAPGLRVLATSRRRFGAPGAITVELLPLPTGAHGGRPSPAARLLAERAGACGAVFDDATTSDPAVVQPGAERLAAALEGVPLALELAAARVPVLGFDGVLERLEAPGRDAPALAVMNQPMRRVLEGSWDLLERAEQEALAQCAVFRGAFSAEAAEAIVSSQPAGPPVVELLQALRDHSLLYSRTLDGGEVRLRMLSPVRDFALEKLRERGRPAAVLRRHAAYYARAFEQAGGRPGDAGARVAREAEDLFAAAEFSITDEDGDLETGLRALIALEPAFSARTGAALGYVDMLDRALDRAAAAGAAPDGASTPALAMRVRQIRARLDAPAGRRDRARADLELCLRDAVDRGDARAEGLSWLDLAVVHHLERAWADARRCYDAAIARLARGDDPAALGRCLANMGALSHDERDFASAAKLYRRAIAWLERAGEDRQRANAMANLALLEQELGRRAEARRLYEAALALLESIRDARVLAIVLGNSATLELELGSADRAASLLERSLELLAGCGDAHSEGLGLARLGASLAVLGRVDEAEARLNQADALLLDGDAVLDETVSLMRAFVDWGRGRRHLRAGDRDAARQYAAGARARLEQAVAEHGVHERSDDVRSALRMLRPLVAALEVDCG